ncbi:hypothetical protein DPMN_079435 [Dreissena polymorpha]|uniref:Uncharacterized protein n=1 Tax=Dreissena polymorpha TaxID=45954 RepID=A0A9D3YSK1_DREPO|nr:hypothetical protein DPMN_079435 [Dreissena polymorpha]
MQIRDANMYWQGIGQAPRECTERNVILREREIPEEVAAERRKLLQRPQCWQNRVNCIRKASVDGKPVPD